MKRIIALLLSLALLFSFAACSKGNGDSEEKTTEEVEITGIGATARVEITTDNSGSSTLKNNAQIPTFIVDGESEAITALNSRIESEVKTFCDEKARETVLAANCYTQVIDEGQYLQVICTYGPSFSLDGPEVATYIYDKANDKEFTLEEAFTESGYETGSIRAMVKKYYAKSSEDEREVTACKVLGFCLNQSGIYEFFVKADTTYGDSEEVITLTVIPEINEVIALGYDEETGLSKVEVKE